MKRKSALEARPNKVNAIQSVAEMKETRKLIKQCEKELMRDVRCEVRALKSANTAFKSKSKLASFIRTGIAGVVMLVPWSVVGVGAACMTTNNYGFCPGIEAAPQAEEVEEEDWMRAETKEEAEAIYKEVTDFFEANVADILPDAPGIGVERSFQFEYRGVTFNGRMIIIPEVDPKTMQEGHAMYIEIVEESHGFKAQKRYFVADDKKETEVNEYKL
jgi:hypothetical protein